MRLKASILALFSFLLVGVGSLLIGLSRGKAQAPPSRFALLLETYQTEGLRPDPRTLMNQFFSGMCHHPEGMAFPAALLVAEDTTQEDDNYAIIIPFRTDGISYGSIAQVMAGGHPVHRGILGENTLRVLPAELPTGDMSLPAFLRADPNGHPILLMGPDEENALLSCTYPLIITFR